MMKSKKGHKQAVVFQLLSTAVQLTIQNVFLSAVSLAPASLITKALFAKAPIRQRAVLVIEKEQPQETKAQKINTGRIPAIAL